MAIQRMDNVLIVVEDLDVVIAFFVELGMELEGRGPIEGRWVEQVIGIDDVRQDVAMLRTPDGHGRVELARFHTPRAIRSEPKDAPANTLGIRRIMFAVEDVEGVVERLRAHGAELVGELAQYEDRYRLCYVRGPEGIVVGLAEELRDARGASGWISRTTSAARRLLKNPASGARVLRGDRKEWWDARSKRS